MKLLAFEKQLYFTKSNLCYQLTIIGSLNISMTKIINTITKLTLLLPHSHGKFKGQIISLLRFIVAISFHKEHTVQNEVKTLFASVYL